MLVRFTLPIAIAALTLPGCAKPQPVANVEAACAVATDRVTAEKGLPVSHVAFCDNIPEKSGRPGYYIMALRAHCREELCGSTLMGWFAVQKATGEVFEVDVTDWSLGRPVDGASAFPRAAPPGPPATVPAKRCSPPSVPTSATSADCG